MPTRPNILCYCADTMIMLIDDQFRRIVRALRDSGQLDNTLIVYMSDPGEFDNLWDQPAARELKAERIRAHLGAMMATVSAGPPRSVAY